MSDTPRTDSLLTAILDSDGYVAHRNCPPPWVSHARELERELNRACEMYRKLDIHTLNLVDRIRRLEEAGDALSKTQTYDLIENVNWRKAKEAKP